MTRQELTQLARSLGASDTRVADLALLAGIPTSPPDLLAEFTRAVSIAVRVSDPVMDGIADRPTPLYAQHYQRVNALLDMIATRVALALQDMGARALALPASQTLDRENCASYLSHKAVAVAAGIGWQGKSLLTVHPRFGPRIRLVSVLTDHPLEPDPRLKNRCGACDRCARACPAGAIKNASTDWHYASRDEALHFERCKAQTHAFAEDPLIGAPICGVCVAVCPFGRRDAKQTSDRRAAPCPHP